MTILHPTPFPNIAHFALMVQDEELIFEAKDNYVKQTFRNRYEIFGPNGKLALTIPVNYSQKNRQLYKDVKIANDDQWQKQHLKSLRTAYNMSPFYEFYEDDLMPIFTERFDFIFDFNLKSIEILNECLQIELGFNFTNQFTIAPENTLDLRYFVEPKSDLDINFKEYTQVFSVKHGFISNLSILDLLFNEGPNSVNLLERNTLT